MSEPEKCENCRFYRASVPGIGSCHRYAPRPGKDYPVWPSIEEAEWCGEWEAKAAAVPTDGRTKQPVGAGGLREGGRAIMSEREAAEKAIAYCVQILKLRASSFRGGPAPDSLRAEAIEASADAVRKAGDLYTNEIIGPAEGDACTG